MNRLPIFALLAVVVVGVGSLGIWQGRMTASVKGDKKADEVTSPGDPATGVAAGIEEISGLERWAARLAAAEATSLPAMAQEAMAVESADGRHRWLRLVAARWAEIDPVGGAEFFAAKELATPEAERNPWPRLWILTEWALRDVEAAWAHVASGEGEGKVAGAADVGTELLRENLDVFWEWFQKAKQPLPRPGEAVSPAWRELARRHAPALESLAAEMAAAPADENQRFNTPKFAGLYALIAESRAETDPAAALAWARMVPDEARSACLRVVLPWLAKADPEAARIALDDLKPKQVGDRFFMGSGREQVIEAIVSEIGKSDPRAAVEWAVRASDGSWSDSIDPIRNVITSALTDGRLTPQEAFALVQEQKAGPGDSIRLNVLRKMWDALPAATLAATAEWLKTNDSGQTKDWALAGLVPAWARSDAEAAFTFTRSLDDPGLRQQVLLEILEARHPQNASPAAVAETLAAIPEADRAQVVADHYRRQYGHGMLEHDFGRASRLDPSPFLEALATAPAGEPRDQSLKQVVGLWGAVDPSGALDWASRQQDPAFRVPSLMGAIEGWAQHDAWSVSQWLADQPRGPDRDAATHQLARSLRDQEPDSAWIWASDIVDPGIRLEARAAVLRRWRQSDATAAAAAVAGVPNLTPAESGKLADTLAGKD